MIKDIIRKIKLGVNTPISDVPQKVQDYADLTAHFVASCIVFSVITVLCIPTLFLIIEWFAWLFSKEVFAYRSFLTKVVISGLAAGSIPALGAYLLGDSIEKQKGERDAD